MKISKATIIIMTIFIWIGFICAISFMESWLKFLAPGITIPLGLGIGRLVFSVLNKVEWVMAAIVMVNLILMQKRIIRKRNFTYFSSLIILVVETFLLLPLMDARAQLRMSGVEVPSSNLHIWFVIAEMIKVICLFLFGLSFLKFSINEFENR